MRDRIRQILEAIDYLEDKEAFANELIGIVQIDVVTDYLEKLPQEQQKKIEADFEQDPDPQKFLELFQSLFPGEDFNQTYEKALEDEIKRWLEAIQSTLTNEQREKIKVIYPQAYK